MRPHAVEAWLGEPDAVIEAALLEDLRRLGVKFASTETFRRHGWEGPPAPRIEPFWKATLQGPVPSADPFLWDLREALLHEQPAWLNAILLWRRLKRFGVEFIGGMETSAIPVVASILAVNRVMHGPPLKAFYLRKERKKDGLRRVLEGARPPAGTRVVAVDDLLNKGISKKPLVEYCQRNDLKLEALLVTVDTGKAGQELFRGVCPVETIFTLPQVLARGAKVSGAVVTGAGAIAGAAGIERAALAPAALGRVEIVEPERRVEVPVTTEKSPIEYSRADVELVRLARDTVAFTALSGGKQQPTLGDDGRGSAGWRAFLGEYLERPGRVFTRISKREFKDGRWINRMRGCECVGLVDPKAGSIAEMTIRSAVATATRARKVVAGAPAFHKPVWPSELGSLSLFLFVVEELVPTTARTADELRAEGHEVQGWGLVGESERHRGAICADLPDMKTVEDQIRAVAGKMQNADGIAPQSPSTLRFLRMRGRWIADPARPRAEYF